MGEANRRRTLREAAGRIMDAADPMEVAWNAFAATMLSASAPPAQRADLRKAFYGGASMMFEAVVHGTDPESEPTDKDMRRIGRIASGLERFAAEMAADMRVEGRA
jgi:hypothetical protein